MPCWGCACWRFYQDAKACAAWPVTIDYPEVLEPLGFWEHKPYRRAHTPLKRMLQGLNLYSLASARQKVLGEPGPPYWRVGRQGGDGGALHLLEALVRERKRILEGVEDEAGEVARLPQGLGLDSRVGRGVIGDAALAERGMAQQVLEADDPLSGRRAAAHPQPSGSLTPSYPPTPARPGPVGRRCAGGRSGVTKSGPAGVGG